VAASTATSRSSLATRNSSPTVTTAEDYITIDVPHGIHL
jgi:hypothetical protein